MNSGASVEVMESLADLMGHTKSGFHTPLIHIALNFCKKKIWTIFIKGFWQADLVSSLFCHFGKIQRIHVVTAYEKSRFHPGLTKEGS
jgi:hypothetical protein